MSAILRGRVLVFGVSGMSGMPSIVRRMLAMWHRFMLHGFMSRVLTIGHGNRCGRLQRQPQSGEEDQQAGEMESDHELIIGGARKEGKTPRYYSLIIFYASSNMRRSQRLALKFL